jgi:aerobic-type carbon monoxide dehydrogenase small subunit (CoxS/CutS family)
MTVQLEVNGRSVEVEGDDGSLLDALREELGITSAKDGCSPQGQCGCCTVLVDGSARAACVTPVRRVAGRVVTTLEGLNAEVRARLVDAFVAAGASQCGFCTPGILVRLASLGPAPSDDRIRGALLGHLCRCTGWQSILEAAVAAWGEGSGRRRPTEDARLAEQRALIEGGTPQVVGALVVGGSGGFAEDTAPPGAHVAVPDGQGGWAVAATLREARLDTGKVQGRRSGRALSYPVGVPPGEWDVTLQTTWVEPGYLEPDASWCLPGGDPYSPVANGGAFGGKLESPAAEAACLLADKLGEPVRVVFSREDVVRSGPKRPPFAGGARVDGTGVLRFARTSGLAASVCPAEGFVAEEVDVVGPPTSCRIRGAGWVEAAVLAAAVRSLGEPSVRGSGLAEVTSPAGARAEATVSVDRDGFPTAVDVCVYAGDILDGVVFRSYVLGAAHMALGWVCSEGIAVSPEGIPEDLTIRSWGILRARDMPPVMVHLAKPEPGRPRRPRNGSDAAFAAVAAATWIAQGLPPRWPTLRGRYR